jgi:hypothetical protein
MKFSLFPLRVFLEGEFRVSLRAADSGTENLPQTTAELHRILRLHLTESGNVRTTLAETSYEATYPKMPQ